MSLGKSSSKQTSETKPLFGGGTQFSRVETVGGGLGTGEGGMLGVLSGRGGGEKRVILDPSIRALQEQGMGFGQNGLNALTGATGEFTSSLGDLRSQLFGNQDPFMQARTASSRERFSRERGQLAQGIDRRGIAGSSFGQQALTSQATEQERVLNDQRALATQESIEAGVSIDQLILQAEQMAAAGNMEQANFLRAIAQDRASVESGLLTATGSKATGTSSGFNIGLPAPAAPAPTGGN